MRTLAFLLLAAMVSQGQPTIYNADTTLAGDTLTTLRPVIKCPFDTGVVFWTNPADGPMGTGPYWHSMTFFDDSVYHLGIDDSHALEPGQNWCFSCVEGTSYEAVTWDEDSAAAITPPLDCSMVPGYSIDMAPYPRRFHYDEPYAEALGERWSVIADTEPTFSAPYTKKTPRYSNYPFYVAASALYWRVGFTFESGAYCIDTVVLSGSGADLMPTKGVQAVEARTQAPQIFDLTGRPADNPRPGRLYVIDGVLQFFRE